jgi:hypothetical protein
MRKLAFCICVLSAVVSPLLTSPIARATIFGSVRGIVHDAQHRPVPAATVTLTSATSAWTQSTQTDQDGAFAFAAVPVGDYRVTVVVPGFADAMQTVTVVSDSSPVLHFQLKLAAVNQTTTVSAEASDVATTDSVTPTTLVDRADIAQTPGADRTNSLQMITDFVPGSYYTHDQLHVRGGHQVSWLIDGVEIPNTNIASNLGPQIDPKDIDYLEVQRGSYGADYGDRTFGVFQVVPRTGFERNNEGELVTTFGNWFQTNDQVNFGGHTQKFAYYASVNANRSNLGLQTPIGQVFHDAENGYGGFGSLTYNINSEDQLRLVASLRQDYYQIPIDPNNPSSSGLRDAEHERDGYVLFSWVKTFNPNVVLTVSPFYHYNSADYNSAPNDTPVATTDNRASTYAGVQTNLAASIARNNLQLGVYGFGQRDNELFGLIFNPPNQCPVTPGNPGGICSNIQPPDNERASGGVVEEYIDDKFKVTSWLTLMAGVRETQFRADITENATSPRFGVAVRVPHLNWVFRAFYGHYYQAPPLLTASGPLLTAVQEQNLSFIPLHGERDEEHQFGVTIPFHGWVLDADTFQTEAHNFFDHNNVGESNIFFPVTIQEALIQAWELTVRSPLDHDQRNTLNAGFEATLPWHTFASSNLYYGSGFTNGTISPQFPRPYLSDHTTFDISLGKSFGENYSIGVTALNVANRHLLIDNSLTFGGFHFNDPREIYAEFRWHFHY